jgi:hypothetical protein
MKLARGRSLTGLRAGNLLKLNPDLPIYKP